MNGSKLLLVCVLIALTSWGCSTSKNLPTSAPSDHTDRDVPRVYNPVTGKYEPVANPKSTIDTIQWTTIEDVEPIGTIAEDKTGKKDQYEIALLLPLNAGATPPFTDNIDGRSRRFLNYYAGLKMGVRRLADQGVQLNVRVFDTEESAEKIQATLLDLRDADLIIGPYDRSNIRLAADFARKHRIPVVSPWIPSIQLDEPCDKLIQLTPGLPSHANAAMAFVGSSIFNPKIYITGRPSEQASGRFEIYHTAHTALNPGMPPIEELIIDDASIDLNETILEGMFNEEGTTVFILPFYSRSDEEFLNGLLRKLHAERGENDVVVIGLPQWANFRRINLDYLESLQVHITAVSHMDYEDPEVRGFSRAYFDQYAGLPETAAYDGYQTIQFFGNALHDFGLGFIQDVTKSERSAYAILLKPVYAETVSAEISSAPEYYENQGIQILKFSEQAFHPLR